jgi:hypothetical protein
MLLLSSLLLAQATPVPTPTEIVKLQEIRPLPGQLDRILVFNSNSPELIQQEGILLSTFPGKGKQHPQAHLNFPLTGRFDLFAHHVAKAKSDQDQRPLYFGVLLHNPGSKSVKVQVFDGSTSYLSQSEAPFVDGADFVKNTRGQAFSGPGSRTAFDVLYRDTSKQTDWPTKLDLLPQESKMLVNLPISAAPTSSRTTLMRLYSTGNLYVASMALFPRPQDNGDLRPPLLEEWQQLLQQGNLASPRDHAPSPPGSQGSEFYYGRVAGVSQGVQWQTKLTDQPAATMLTIPQLGQAFSYALNTIERGTLGTKQIQSAPIVARYPDTAYRANGNYGIRYKLELPLYNPTDAVQKVAVLLQTPIKEDQLSPNGLRFFLNPAGTVFFRGTVRVRYTDDLGQRQDQSFHLTQRRGQQGTPLVTLDLAPQTRRPVQVELVYPPDATPPQVLTIQTLMNE